jgi:hypothetical protein
VLGELGELGDSKAEVKAPWARFTEKMNRWSQLTLISRIGVRGLALVGKSSRVAQYPWGI